MDHQLDVDTQLAVRHYWGMPPDAFRAVRAALKEDESTKWQEAELQIRAVAIVEQLRLFAESYNTLTSASASRFVTARIAELERVLDNAYGQLWRELLGVPITTTEDQSAAATAPRTRRSRLRTGHSERLG